MPRPRKILTKQDILRAMKHTLSNKAASRYLQVSYPHYKKYAKLFVDEETGKTLFEKHKNRSGKGINKVINDTISTRNFIEILRGERSAYSWNPKKLKAKLIKEAALEEKCDKCNFSERRVLDLKVPLILHFVDGNKANWKIENLKFLCYNCYFLYIDNILSAKKIESIEDYSTPISEVQIKDDWEVDEHALKHLEDLGLFAEPSSEEEASEYIDYL